MKELKPFLQNRRNKYTAVFVSLAAHMAFILTSSVFRIPGVIVPPSSPQKLFQVKISRSEAVVSQPDTPAATPSSPEEKFRFESPSSTKAVEAFLKKEQEESKDKRSMVLHDKMKNEATAEPVELIGPKESTINYDYVRKASERKTISKLTNTIELNLADIIDDAQKVSKQSNFSKDFVDKTPGFTPALVKKTFDIAKRADVKEFKQAQMPVISRMNNVGSLESELMWTLGVYQDPKDKQKYFKITIRVGEDNNRLKTNNKEILFLVDGSSSVEDERLDEFRDGIKQSLSLLNEGDLFNVIVFKEIIFEFKKESVPPNKENIEEAIKFMEKFRTAEKTDAFEVLTKSIRKKSKRTPSYIVLLSDGRPTKGVTNSRELINKLSDYNNGRKAIFTLTGGLRINRYLLDFISFKNRGWSEYAKRTHYIGDQLIDLYKKIDDPIILNLRYYLSGINDDETFPNVLPDFFRHAEFTLYGKYDDRKIFAMQLLGDIGGKTKEYLLRSDFSEAYKGDEEIARNWAFNKLYHLISELEYDRDNQKILDEINAISEKFDLKTPYLEDIIQ